MADEQPQQQRRMTRRVPTEPPKPRCRVIINETMYHVNQRGRAVSHRGRFVVFCDSEDQPYQRQYKVGADWTELDLGHVPADKLLFIGIAHERPLPTTIPSPERARAIAAIEVQVAFGDGNGNGPHLSIPCGQSLRCRPCGKVFLRSTSGEAVVTVTVVPR